jgi:hypothetical protein
MRATVGLSKKKELCLKYDILNIYNYLENPVKKPMEKDD